MAGWTRLLCLPHGPKSASEQSRRQIRATADRLATFDAQRLAAVITAESCEDWTVCD
jgi:hypothetical protein